MGIEFFFVNKNGKANYPVSYNTILSESIYAKQ